MMAQRYEKLVKQKKITCLFKET